MPEGVTAPLAHARGSDSPLGRSPRPRRDQPCTSRTLTGFNLRFGGCFPALTSTDLPSPGYGNDPSGFRPAQPVTDRHSPGFNPALPCSRPTQPGSVRPSPRSPAALPECAAGLPDSAEGQVSSAAGLPDSPVSQGSSAAGQAESPTGQDNVRRVARRRPAAYADRSKPLDWSPGPQATRLATVAVSRFTVPTSLARLRSRLGNGPVDGNVNNQRVKGPKGKDQGVLAQRNPRLKYTLTGSRPARNAQRATSE